MTMPSILSVVAVLLIVTALYANTAVSSTVSSSVSISVDWSQVIRVSKTTPTYQAVVNPLVTRESPIHDNVYEAMRTLGAEHVRFQGWYPYPKLVVAELMPPSGLSQCASVAKGFVTQLDCRGPTGKGIIDTIQYASFGTVTGYCGGFITGNCSATSSVDVVTRLCAGKPTCQVPADQSLFNNPCPKEENVRLSIQVTCSPALNNTYYDFSLMNPIVEDVMKSLGENHTNIINFSTIPAWLFQQSPTSAYYPDDPYQCDFAYKYGTALADSTAETIGQYFGRLAGYYTNNGFIDEYGRKISSPYHYKFNVWEILNELEHYGKNEKEYTKIYDSIVKHVRLNIDPALNLEFAGPALAHIEIPFLTYFLNPKNHQENITVDWVSYHHYANSKTRDNPIDYENFFPDYDEFISQIKGVEIIRQELSPLTRTTIDEIGVILPEDNNISSVAFPLIYWNAASAAFAYIFSQVSIIGIDVIGSSQLMGYPQVHVMNRTLSPQYPSVSLLNWTTGHGTPRYWTVKLLIEQFGPNDLIINTTISNNTDIYAQAYNSGKTQTQRILVINKKFHNKTININGINNGFVLIIDESNGDKPARKEMITSNIYILQPFAVAVFILPQQEKQIKENNIIYVREE